MDFPMQEGIPENLTAEGNLKTDGKINPAALYAAGNLKTSGNIQQPNPYVI